MYHGLAARLRLETEQVDDVQTSDVDRAVLLVHGAGAAVLLRNEAGLHRLRSGDPSTRLTENVAVRTMPLGGAFDVGAMIGGNGDSALRAAVASSPIVHKISTKIEFVSLPGRLGSTKRARVHVQSTDPLIGSLQFTMPAASNRERGEPGSTCRRAPSCPGVVCAH